MTKQVTKYINIKFFFVRGLVFQSGVRGDDEEHGLVEFVFGDKFGVYEDLVHVRNNQTYIKVLGKPYDVTAPSLNIALEKELVTDGIQRWYDTTGSRDDCSIHFAAKSFALLGHEPWELISRDGSSVCIRLEDTTTYIPGIVRDVASLGFDYEPYNICAVILGCTPEGRKNITLIPNFETHGVLRR